MEERARKRKLESISDDESQSLAEADQDEEKEQPREGLHIHGQETPAKKQRLSKAKQAKKAEKRIKAQEKRAEKRKAKETKAGEEGHSTPAEKTNSLPPSSLAEERKANVSNSDKPVALSVSQTGISKGAKEKLSEGPVQEKGISQKNESKELHKTRDETIQNEPTQSEPEALITDISLAPNSSPDTNPLSPTFDHSPQQESGEGDQISIDTSVNDLSGEAPMQKRDLIKVPDQDRMALFKQRLDAKLAEFREARGAGPDGKPVRSREDLIEARRREQAKKKAHKQELKRKAKEEEARQREEALKAASSRSSPLGSLSPSTHEETNFSFGRVTFSDGAQMSRDGSYILNKSKKKGPSDPKTALIKIENQKARFAAMDEDKRKEILEKETWLAARKKADGEKIRNEEALIKKTAKRKEKAKKKSEKEWKARNKAVEQAKVAKQRKREDNIRKRREEKALGKMGKKLKGRTGKKASGKGSVKKVSGRSGFEGRGGLL